MLGPGGGSGRATFTKPETREITLPEGSLFPTAYRRLVIEMANQGVLPIARVVFDGFDPDKNGMDLVSTVVGKQKPADTEAPTPLNGPFRNVQRARFVIGAKGSIPHMVNFFRLYDNGIEQGEAIEYYKPPQRLKVMFQKLELLPLPSC